MSSLVVKKKKTFQHTSEKTMTLFESCSESLKAHIKRSSLAVTLFQIFINDLICCTKIG